jgi:formate-dependent nitrite reductase membrane component NrfD
MTEIELGRHNAHIDPHLSVWGWEIPVYLFLGGLAAGIMILTALDARRPAAERSRVMRLLPLAAPAVLSLGMLALFLDLHCRLHVFRFYTALRVTSPMSWGSWILLGVYPATLMLGLASLSPTEAEAVTSARLARALHLQRILLSLRRLCERHPTALRWANLLLGMALGVYTGVLLSNLGARAAWNSALLGPLFLVSGVSAGAAFLMLFPVNPTEHELLRRWDLAAIGVEVALLLLYLTALATGAGRAGADAAALFLGGRFTAVFWSIVVIAGLGVPVLLEAIGPRRSLRPTLLAPALVLVGGLALRWIVVLAGQA